MQIKQDPMTGLYCRSDGAVLMPPNRRVFKTFRWTFGTDDGYGYRRVMLHGKNYFVHRAVCRAFGGLAPIDKPCVDHINRIKSDNRPENLRWVSYKENNDNRDCVDQSVAKFGVRYCDDRAAYERAHKRAYRAAHPERSRAWSKAYRERHK